MRDNVQAGGPEDYFRKSITVPRQKSLWIRLCHINRMYQVPF